MTREEILPGDEFEQKATMVHAMMLACYADKKIASQQIAVIESYAKSLPEFYGHDFQKYYGAAKEIASSAGGNLDRAIGYLSRIESRSLREKTYCCCVELALADGHLGTEEETFLAAAQQALDIAEETVARINDVLGIKYGVHQLCHA